LFLFCLIEFFNRFAVNHKIDAQDLSIKVSIKRNIFPRRMIKTQMNKTEKYLIYFLIPINETEKELRISRTNFKFSLKRTSELKVM
jgi:hypothetical protein